MMCNGVQSILQFLHLLTVMVLLTFGISTETLKVHWFTRKLSSPKVDLVKHTKTLTMAKHLDLSDGQETAEDLHLVILRASSAYGK